MYDELKKMDNDNPTLGVVLCTETDEDIARYSVLHDNDQLFASKYKIYLPTEEELRAEIETQKAFFYLFAEKRKRQVIVLTPIGGGSNIGGTAADVVLRNKRVEEERHERKTNCRGNAANVTMPR